MRSRRLLFKIILYIIIVLISLLFAKRVHSIFTEVEVTNNLKFRESYLSGYLKQKPILQTPDPKARVLGATPRIQIPSLTASRVGNEEVKALIKKYFPNNYQQALNVAYCESGLRNDAQNKISSAGGIFQIIDGTWISNTDIPLSKKYDAALNILVASRIFKRRGWSPWVCRP